jgi:glycosyltransferase involved in cell wall biosynthesis
MKKNILFIHQSFPGQFGHLAEHLAQEGHRVVAMALTPQGEVDGVSLVRYNLVRKPQEDLPDLLREPDVKILRAQSAALTMRKLDQQGFKPDVVYAHPGWGEAMFVKTIWPDTRLLVYAEWYYNQRDQEVGFDPEFSQPDDQALMRLQLKNSAFLHALSDADAGIAPTRWQKSRFPAWAQDKIRVIHDGINLPKLSQGPPKSIRIPQQNACFKYGDPIVTFVARHLEPVRGFHILMRAIPQILRRHPTANIFILGHDAGAKGTGYGGANPLGKTWRQSLHDELGSIMDLSRVHFLGSVEYKVYLSIMRLSACHVYLTTPFILSWSFLEAAALGVPIVASRTAPVEEFSSLDGLELVDFFDYSALARSVVDVLQRPVIRTPNQLPEQSLDFTLPRLSQIIFSGSSALPSAPAEHESTKDSSGLIEVEGSLHTHVEEVLVQEPVHEDSAGKQSGGQSVSPASVFSSGPRNNKDKKRRHRRR